MNVYALLTLMLIVACSPVNTEDGQVIVPVISDRRPVIDGQVTEKEWQGAHRVAIDDGVSLLMFQTDEDVWLAVKADTESPPYVDIFLLLDDKQRINLHASMQVGERAIPADGWTDRVPPTKWGKQDNWQANFVKEVPGKDDSASLKEQLAPYDGFEFRLSRERFTGRQWRMRWEVRDFAGVRKDIVFPKESTRFDAETWALVLLDREVAVESTENPKRR